MNRARRPALLSAETQQPPEAPLLRDQFAAGYARWFGPVYAYVSRHVAGQATRELLVRQVLAENLDLLVGRREEVVEASRLRATADRLIAGVVDEADRFLELRRQDRTSRLPPR